MGMFDQRFCRDDLLLVREGAIQPDFTELFLLTHAELFHPDQLKDGKECNDQFGTRGGLSEKLFKAHRDAAIDKAHQVVDSIRDRESFLVDLSLLFLNRKAFKRALEGIDEVEDAYIADQQIVIEKGGMGRIERDRAGK